MNGNKYEKIQLSIDSCNSYLGALTFLSNSFKKSSSKRWKWQNTEEIPKFDIHQLCVILQVFTISRPRKQRISGFLSVLIWLWVCFAKRAMFWCEFRWVLSLLYPLRFADILQKNFFKFFFVRIFIHFSFICCFIK